MGQLLTYVSVTQTISVLLYRALNGPGYIFVTWFKVAYQVEQR